MVNSTTRWSARQEPNVGKCQGGIKPALNGLFILTGIFFIVVVILSLKEGHYLKVLSIRLLWVFPDQHTKHVFACPALSANLIISFSKHCSCLLQTYKCQVRGSCQTRRNLQNHLLQTVLLFLIAPEHCQVYRCPCINQVPLTNSWPHWFLLLTRADSHNLYSHLGCHSYQLQRQQT